MVTAQEAKEILERQRANNRKRQREFAQAMKEKGYRRIAVYISPEAYSALEGLRGDDRTTGDIVTDAILHYSRPPAPTQAEAPPASIPPDKAELFNLIDEMKTAGHTWQSISDHLEKIGTPTPAGHGSWTLGKVEAFHRRHREK